MKGYSFAGGSGHKPSIDTCCIKTTDADLR